jgi:hypothetical protein
VGASFLTPLFAPRSVDVIFSASAMHWMSSGSTDSIVDHIVPSMSSDAKSVQRVAAHAAKEWAQQIQLRAKELRHGGRLVLVVPGRDADGNVCYTRTWPGINAILLEFVHAKRLERTVYEQQCNVAFYFRSRKEFLAPLAAAGLAVEYCELHRIPCQYQGMHDSAAYAAAFVQSIRVWGDAMLLRFCCGDVLLLAALYAELRRRFAALHRDDVASIDNAYRQMYLVVSKTTTQQ